MLEAGLQSKFGSKITLSCTPEDKLLLKRAALERGTTVSAMLHEWVERDLRVRTSCADDGEGRM